ncbi:MAG: DNA-3-methyladenine glycosylase I [Alphaproteobacteria bacterium]|nr:DNA-3-methyladenine glycosylase I [Alphaproteobacteria bacterium]
MSPARTAPPPAAAAELVRCAWCGSDPLYVAYHDTEWGVPERDDRALYEKLVLDGFQAGLAWITVLRKREAFRAAFKGFDPARVARFGERDIERLLADAGIIRHRGKIEAAIAGARAVLALQEQGGQGAFSRFIWDVVDGRPIQNHHRRLEDVPAETEMSRRLSLALKARGFRFCGPTITYAFAQAIGLVNDHLTSCFRHRELADG